MIISTGMGNEKGPDSQFSSEPNEFKELCKRVNDSWLSLGKAGFDRYRSEDGSRVFRRLIYFVKDLPKGHILEEGDIRRIRPGYGLAPRHFDKLIGRQLEFSVKRGAATKWDLLT